MVSKVEVLRSPITTVARGRCTSDPGLVEVASRRTPAPSRTATGVKGSCRARG